MLERNKTPTKISLPRPGKSHGLDSLQLKALYVFVNIKCLNGR